MFIVGLELDLEEFVKHRNKSLTFGFFTFIIPLLIGYPVCHFLLGYDVKRQFPHGKYVFPHIHWLPIHRQPSGYCP